MDWVSSLLEQARLTASIDIWCRLPAGARLVPDVPAGATAPFHLVIDGRCSVHVADRVVELRTGRFSAVATRTAARGAISRRTRKDSGPGHSDIHRSQSQCRACDGDRQRARNRFALRPLLL